MRLPRHLIAVLFAIWFALAVLLALIATGCAAPRVIEIERRTVIRVERLPCWTQDPPAHPELAGDAAIDSARLAQAYDSVRLWLELYALPSCRE